MSNFDLADPGAPLVSNLDRYKSDLAKLIKTGERLRFSLEFELRPERVKKAIVDQLGKDKLDAQLRDIPEFRPLYEAWYSESLVTIRQLLPDRLNDFIGRYERPKNRRHLEASNYTMQDFIQGTVRADGSVTLDAATALFSQQMAMLKACEARFESSLFEIRQLVQADLFDSEVDAGRELLKQGFGRAAGAIAGVVLEKHLRQVCDDHKITVTKKHPGISDLNELLKSNSVISIPQWRHITLLGDIRNLCDHSKTVEPTKDQVSDLLDGTDKVLKTIF